MIEGQTINYRYRTLCATGRNPCGENDMFYSGLQMFEWLWKKVQRIEYSGYRKPDVNRREPYCTVYDTVK